MHGPACLRCNGSVPQIGMVHRVSVSRNRLHLLAPPVPYAQQLRKKLQSGSYRSAKDFYYDMESLVFDPKHMMTYFYFPVSGEVVAKDGSVTKADDDMLCDYHKMIEFAMYTVQSQTYFWETELFSDVKGVPEKLAFAGWSIEEMDGLLQVQNIAEIDA